MDLRDLFVEDTSLTPSLVLALVYELPVGSRTASLMSGVEDSSGWGINSYLLASLINAVRENTFANMQVRTKKKLSRPEPVNTPLSKREEKKPAGNTFVRMAQAQFAKE